MPKFGFVSKKSVLPLSQLERLVRNIYGMDKESFISMVKGFGPRLRSMARVIVGNDDDADDALQDAFCSLWSHREELEDRRADAMAVATVRSRSIDVLRRRAVRLGSGQVEAAASDLHAVDSTDIADTYAQVRSIMNTVLSSRDADILVLRDYQGYEIDEIAARYGLVPANVRIILSRSRRAVRDAYLKNFQS